METVPNLFPTVISTDGIVKVAMIGEAPGRDEVIAGQPFVGAAGRELERWIKPFFIRSQCFIGNVSQDRPPDNKLSNFFTDTACRQPNERLQNWINILAEQLERVRPNIILALGRHPTFLLTGREANWHRKGEFTWGSILPCKLVPGLKVMPLPHPSFVMRGMFDLRPIIRVWLRRAKAQSQFPDIRYPYRELVVDPSLEQVMFELDRLMSSPKLSFDIETIPGRKVIYRNEDKGLIYNPDVITCISFSDAPDWAISIPFTKGSSGNHRWALEVEKEIWKGISRLLGQHGPLKIAHNLTFDFMQLAARKIFVAPPRWDTMTGHNRAYLDLTKKKLKKLALNRLAVCTSLYTEEPFYKNDWKDENKGENWAGADQEFWRYNAKDSAVLHEIQETEERDLEQMGMLPLFIREMRAFNPLAAASLLGVKRNEEIINDLALFLENKEGTGRIQSLQNELDSVVGFKLNTKSSQQMQKFLYSVMGFPIQFNKHTKRPTADEGALAKLYQKTKHPILLRIKELTRLRGFQSNYIDSAISLDGRSRTSYNQARTSTARISSSDAIIGSGKNLQTIPSRPRPGEDDYNRLIKEYKKSFVADEGKLLGKRDYVQAEAMVVAWLAEDLQQIDDFQNGADIHCRTVQILYDCDYQEALDGYRNKEPEWTLRRNVLAKPTRHGFNYRLGPRQLSQMFALAGFNVPEAECRRMLQAMASGVPSVVRWQAEVEDQLKSTRAITNAFGLRRTFFGMIDDDAVREAIAFNPQSTVGQLMNFALERVYHESGVMTDLDILLQIHDAVIFQSPVDKLQQHSAIVGELMDIPLEIKGRRLVIPSDIEVGPNWGELSKPDWEV